VRGPRPRLLIWSGGYSLFVGVIWLCRARGTNFVGFHYLFPALAALAPVAAVGLSKLFPGIVDVTRSRGRRVVEMGALLIALHAGGFFAVLDSKRQDAEQYSRSRAGDLLAALERAQPAERIAVIGAAAFSFHGLTDYGVMPGRESALVREIESLFIWRRHIVDPSLFEQRAGDRQIALVVDFSLQNPGPYSVAAWKALSTAAGEAR